MTPAGIEQATFGFVAQHLNHCAAAVPPSPNFEGRYPILNTPLPTPPQQHTD